MSVWLVYGPAHCLAGLCDEDAEPTTDWTIHKDARVGDFVLFYLKAPLCAIVASGRIVTSPKYEAWAEEWSRTMPYAATMEIDAVYNPPIGYRQMVKDRYLFNEWGLLRSQMQSGIGPQIVPDSVIDRLTKVYDLSLIIPKATPKKKPAKTKHK